MKLAKLIVFVSLYYVVSAVSVSTKQGYLIMNTAEKASCHNMPKNQMCPSFNHQVVGADKNQLAFVRTNLQAVKLQLAAVKFFNDTQACLNDLREYSCSNLLMKCTTSNVSAYGFKLEYDVKRTEQACANVTKSCYSDVQATVHNCSLIQRDPFQFAICNKHTAVTGDICPSTDHLYPVAITKLYPIHAKTFIADFAKYGAGFKNDTCRKEVAGVYCQIMRGAICSTDMTKRMYAISRQDCFATMNKCISIPAYKAYFQEVCKLLPDGKTAPRVPLPILSNSNNAANSG